MEAIRIDHSLNARVGLDTYPILIGKGVLNNLEKFLESYKRENIFIICDSYFSKYEFTGNRKVFDLLNTSGFNYLFVNGGIESKSLESYQKIIEALSNANISRDGLIVSIGGGVIGDLAGFVASTYQRGIDLVHVPTTTTAMIDSCIGGKTGINSLDQVNLVGTYYNPKAIFIDIEFLLTLNDRDYYAGICEAIKMAITSDYSMTYRLLEISDYLNKRDIKYLTEIIYWAVLTKLKHVADDAKEESIRLLLNYGHTFGQSIETYYGLYQDHLRHGEAVALGIKVAAKLSEILYRSKTSKELSSITDQLLSRYNLPRKFIDLSTNDYPNVNLLLENLVNDKKRVSTGNRFIVCDSIGSANVRIITNKTNISDAFEALY